MGIDELTPENAAPEPVVLKKIELEESEWIEIRDDGVWHCVILPTNDPVTKYTRLSRSVIDVEGIIRPIDAEDAGLAVRIDDERHTMHRDKAVVPQDLGRWLASRGARFNSTKLSTLSRMFMEVAPSTITGYTRNGWAKNGAFVIGDRIMFGDGCVIDPSDHGSAGTFEDWEREVLARAHQKPMWIFAILVGLSSVLLKPLGIDTGTAFNPYGSSGSGKTDALRAAAGLWGHDTMKSFRTTLNGLENLFETSNHIGLALDEMKSADKKMLMDFAYLFGNGEGKERMRSNAEQVRKRRWLCNCIMSSEKSVEGIFDAMEQTQAAGMVTRLIEFDARRWLPIIPLADVVAFENAVRTHYGTAGPEFVRRIVALDDLADRHTRSSHALYDGEDPRLMRAARVFGQLKVVQDVMGIETTVVDEIWDQWSGEVVEAFDDDLQIGRDVLEFIEGRLNASIFKVEEADVEDAFGDEGGERRVGTRDADGWYDDEYVYLRLPALSRVMDGYGKQAFYGWLHAHGVLQKPSRNSDRWTSYVPVIRPRVTGLKLDYERLREVVEARVTKSA